MSDYFVLISTIQLNKYKINLYRLNSENNYVSNETISSLYNQLNNLELASEIVEVLQVLNGVVKIEVYDLFDSLLIDSGIILE
jgi:oligoendopeptidase F